MTDADLIAATLKGAMALTALWVVVFWCWRPYRVDSFRQKLFMLRHELFAFAADGGVGFDEPAYQELRMRINGMIRFADRISFSRFFFTIMLNRISHNPLLVELNQGWSKKIASVKTDRAKKQLMHYHANMDMLMLQHIITGSVTLLVAMPFTLFCMVVKHSFDRFLERFAISSPWVKSGLDMLEAQSVEACS